MEKSFKKSQEQAEVIKMIALYVELFDIEYCKEAATDFKNQALRQETLMILNPNHSQIKNEILRKQGEALDYLCKYAQAIKDVQNLKSQLSKEKETKDQISKMFV